VSSYEVSLMSNAVLIQAFKETIGGDVVKH
jgi:hypothetical protein